MNKTNETCPHQWQEAPETSFAKFNCVYCKKEIMDIDELLEYVNELEIAVLIAKGKRLTICEACGGDGSIVLTDNYKGRITETVKCVYCNGSGYQMLEEENND